MSHQKRDSLTIGEAAKELGFAVDTVRRLANDGRLRATTTPGGHRRFSRRTLEAYRTREQGPTPRAQLCGNGSIELV